MDVVNAILSEEEVLDMPQETLSAFTAVFNSEMLRNVNDYMKRSDANPSVVNKLRECGSLALKGSVFSTQVTDKNIQQMVRKCDLRSLPDLAYNHEVDLNEVIDALTWLSENEMELQATIAPRTEDKYKAALEEVTKYQKNPEFNHQHNIPVIMKSYKTTLFCPKQEKARKTDTSRLATNRLYWKMQLVASKYLDYCTSKGISRTIAGEC